MVEEKILKALVTIGSLSDQQIKTLSEKLSVEEVPPGKYIFKEGDNDGKNIYLLEGEMVLAKGKKPLKLIKGGTNEALHPIAHNQPRPYSAASRTALKILRIDSQMLDTMIAYQHTGTTEETEDEDADWMTVVLTGKAFSRIPPANIQGMFLRMEEVHKQRGEYVVTQGDDGDFYYIIKSGKCAVVRKTRTQPKGVKLAELGVGDSFGEEALISDSKRNASIVMLTEGNLMRLSKENFITLLNEPLISWVDYAEACSLVADSGAIWLDVRLPAECQTGHMPSAINIPNYQLRSKVGELDDSKSFILYCDSGGRSSSVAFLLSERGFDVRVLKGGLVKAPPDILVKEAC